MKCDICGKEEPLPFRCKYCDGVFCSSHRLPEGHHCPKLPLPSWDQYKVVTQTRELEIKQIEKWRENQETGCIQANIKPLSNHPRRTVLGSKTKRTRAGSDDIFIGLILIFVGITFIIVFYYNSTSYEKKIEKANSLANDLLLVNPLDTECLIVYLTVKPGTTVVRNSYLKVAAWESNRKFFDIYIFDTWNSAYDNVTEIKKYERVALYVVKNISDVIFKVPIAMRSEEYYFYVVNSDSETVKTVNIAVALEWEESKTDAPSIIWSFILAVVGFFLIVMGLSMIFYPPLVDEIFRRMRYR